MTVLGVLIMLSGIPIRWGGGSALMTSVPAVAGAMIGVRGLAYLLRSKEESGKGGLSGEEHED